MYHLFTIVPKSGKRKEEAESSAPSWKWAIFLLEVTLQQTQQSLAMTGLVAQPFVIHFASLVNVGEIA